MSSLFEDIRNGQIERVKAAISENPAILQQRDENGVGPFLTALYNRQTAIAEVILTWDPALDLYEAAAAGETERVAELIEADPESVSASAPDGWTALHLAAFFGHADVVRILLDAGAGIDMVSGAMGNTPLQAATANDQTEVVELLVSRGADVSWAMAEGGFTALHNAAARGNERIVQILLDNGADPSAEASDGRTPIDFARPRHPELAQMLSSRIAR
ncbi:MAG: ankyrin repeat domain-containing protein [Acidobacteria bacterium]|nr:ankyrin repeat domain-containing protein [Acidobacteriota bacterium]